MQTPAKLNCDSIHPTDPYQYSINSGIYRNTTLTAVSFLVGSGETVIIRVKVRNRAGRISQPTEVEMTAAETG